MIRRPPRSTLSSSSAASDVYKRQLLSPRRPISRPHRRAVGGDRASPRRQERPHASVIWCSEECLCGALAWHEVERDAFLCAAQQTDPEDIGITTAESP